MDETAYRVLSQGSRGARHNPHLRDHYIGIATRSEKTLHNSIRNGILENLFSLIESRTDKEPALKGESQKASLRQSPVTTLHCVPVRLTDPPVIVRYNVPPEILQFKGQPDLLYRLNLPLFGWEAVHSATISA